MNIILFIAKNQKIPIGLFFEDENSRKLAGLTGEIFGNWLCIQFLLSANNSEGKVSEASYCRPRKAKLSSATANMLLWILFLFKLRYSTRSMDIRRFSPLRNIRTPKKILLHKEFVLTCIHSRRRAGNVCRLLCRLPCDAADLCHAWSCRTQHDPCCSFFPLRIRCQYLSGRIAFFNGAAASSAAKSPGNSKRVDRAVFEINALFISLPFPARFGNCPPHHKPHFRC